jgi:hypothetical protein
MGRESLFHPDNSGGIRVHRQVARLATSQHGPAGRLQLLELGLSGKQIDYAVESGRYFVLYPGVYAIGHRDVSALGSFSAAVLACGHGAVLSHRSAGQLHGIVTRYGGPIEVLVARHNPPRLGGIRARTATFGPYETGRRKNIPVTSLARTLLDLATIFDLKELTRCFQRARRQGLTVEQLNRLLARHKGERGTVKLRKLVDRHRGDRGLSNGGFEDAFYAWLLTILPPGFPRPERNIRVALGDGTAKECDLVWPTLQLIIELDHFDHHGGDRVQSTIDARRARELRGQGWTVEHFTSDEFDDDRASVERDVRRLLHLYPS